MNGMERVVYLRHLVFSGRILPPRSVSSGMRNYFSGLLGKTLKGRKDTTEVCVASRCTTQGNHKYGMGYCIAYGALLFLTTDH